MSEKYFRIAAIGAIEPFADALLRAFGEVRAAPSVTLPALADAEAWADRQPFDVMMLYEDNGWAVLIDPAGTRCERGPALAEASRRLGTLVSAAHQDSVGFFQLLVVESGELRRKVEADPDRQRAMKPRSGPTAFRSADLDAAWQSFGLGPCWQDPPGPLTVIPFRTAKPDVRRSLWRRWLRH